MEQEIESVDSGIVPLESTQSLGDSKITILCLMLGLSFIFLKNGLILCSFWIRDYLSSCLARIAVKMYIWDRHE